MRLTWTKWDHLTTRKRLGGVVILNLEMHSMACSFSLLQDMCQVDQSWIYDAIFIEHIELVHGRLRLKHHGGHCLMDVFL